MKKFKFKLDKTNTNNKKFHLAVNSLPACSLAIIVKRKIKEAVKKAQPITMATVTTDSIIWLFSTYFIIHTAISSYPYFNEHLRYKL